jgi:hypothetical protein
MRIHSGELGHAPDMSDRAIGWRRSLTLTRPAVLATIALCFVAMACSAGICTATAAATPPPQTDVMLVFDTSGSMAGVLEEAKSEIREVTEKLTASLPNVEFGLAEVRDYGESIYDYEDDEPWKLDVPLTGEVASIYEGISGLQAAGGGDAPEAYGRALWETDTNPEVGWRPGAQHLIVLVADQVPHDPNVDEGIPEEFWLQSSPWDTGEELEGAWGIPDTQLKEGETVAFHAVLRQLAADEKPLEMVDYHDDTEENYIHYWENWASLAGGAATESNQGGNELASKLLTLIEKAVPCATAAIAAAPSPSSPSGSPTAVTPRFSQPGSAVELTPPSGSRFCPGQKPYLGEDVVTSLEEDTPAKLTFRVPAEAGSNLALTSPSGVPGPSGAYAVDNFRYPWGFDLVNNPGDGDGEYDAHITITADDLDSVFTGLGPPDGDMYIWALSKAQHELDAGLCYGFSVLSWALYGDAHGASDPLAYADNSGLNLASGNEPYEIPELSAGSHALTHALLRAAISQDSPEARSRWQKVSSTAMLEGALNGVFQRGQPAPLIIKFAGGGHALLAFNYQHTAAGLAVDVVDPNVPWEADRPASDYQSLQVDVQPNGTWSYDGTFDGLGPFGKPVGGGPGSLLVVPEPRSPGGLKFLPEGSAGAGTEVDPGDGVHVTAISYSRKPGHGIPSGVRQDEVIDDAPDDTLEIPGAPHAFTVTLSATGGHAPEAWVAGHGFLDFVRTPRATSSPTFDAATGAVSVPVATKGTTLSVTSVVKGVQQSATAEFGGTVVGPTMSVSSSGQVTVTTSGGTGKIKLALAAYKAAGGQAHAHTQTLTIHGRSRLRRQAPRVRRPAKRRRRR